jgi:hypothetical protein
MDSRHFERLGGAERGQDARKPPREHRLAGSRRTREKQVVSPRRRDLERAPRPLVAAHVGEIRERSLGWSSVALFPVQFRLTPQVRDCLREMTHRDRLDTGERCFRGGVGRAQQFVDRGTRCPFRDVDFG